MSHAADRQTGGVTPNAPLVDVSEMSVREILGESALARALERLETETRSPENSYSAFGNFAPDDEPGPAAANTPPGR
jgi:hypothetical protein